MTDPMTPAEPEGQRDRAGEPEPIKDSLSKLRAPGLTTAAWRIKKIAQMHEKYVDSTGGTYGECNECGHTWPCPTYAWATTAREYVLDAWDPADDEESADA
jgi:hypothetical protein